MTFRVFVIDTHVRAFYSVLIRQIRYAAPPAIDRYLPPAPEMLLSIDGTDRRTDTNTVTYTLAARSWQRQ